MKKNKMAIGFFKATLLVLCSSACVTLPAQSFYSIETATSELKVLIKQSEKQHKTNQTSMLKILLKYHERFSDVGNLFHQFYGLKTMFVSLGINFYSLGLPENASVKDVFRNAGEHVIMTQLIQAHFPYSKLVQFVSNVILWEINLTVRLCLLQISGSSIVTTCNRSTSPTEEIHFATKLCPLKYNESNIVHLFKEAKTSVENINIKLFQGLFSEAILCSELAHKHANLEFGKQICKVEQLMNQIIFKLPASLEL